MDPMTQSAQISSSQGFADGQNSAAKESKLSGKTEFYVTCRVKVDVKLICLIFTCRYMLLCVLCIDSREVCNSAMQLTVETEHSFLAACVFKLVVAIMGAPVLVSMFNMYGRLTASLLFKAALVQSQVRIDSCVVEDEDRHFITAYPPMDSYVTKKGLCIAFC